MPTYARFGAGIHLPDPDAAGRRAEFRAIPATGSFSNNQALIAKLLDVIDYLEECRVFAAFGHEYSDRCKYEFRTVEPATIEVMPPVNSSICILYDALHPNFKTDAEEIREEFPDALLPGSRRPPRVCSSACRSFPKG